MKDHAPTAILCPTADTADIWHVHARTRIAAEQLYRQAVESGQFVKPIYRILIQYKVDQYDAQTAPTSDRKH